MAMATRDVTAQNGSVAGIGPPPDHGPDWLTSWVERIDDTISDSSATDAERATAMARKAYYVWTFDRDTAAASRLLDDSDRLAQGYARYYPGFARARILREQGDDQRAVHAAASALDAAESESDRVNAIRLYAQAAIEWGRRAASAGTLGEAEPVLADAAAQLNAVLADDPSAFRSARLLLGISLLRGRGDAVLRAWMLHTGCNNSAAAGDVLAPACTALTDILPGRSIDQLTREEYGRLVTALADSRHHELAAMMVETAPSRAEGNSIAQDALAYERFLVAIRARTARYYVDAARHVGQRAAYDADCERIMRSLWAALVFPDARPEFSREGFDAEVAHRFGTYINFGKTSGYYDLHMGHVVRDERRTIEQYGYEADLGYVLLDRMVSNGWESWYSDLQHWQGEFAHGGWATSETIYHVRSETSPAHWQTVFDDDARSELEREIEESTADDLAKLDEDRYAHIKSLHLRAHRQISVDTVARLRNAGLSGERLEIAFIDELRRMEIEDTIFAHEGRHAIDYGLPDSLMVMQGGERLLEFTSKLSEIAFSSAPSYTFCGILSGSGQNTPHGRASRALIDATEEWVREHLADMPEMDPSKPVRMQLHLLTDEQVLSLVRSLDPLAR